MRRIPITLLAALLVLSAPLFSSTDATAHAPIEWSDPKNDSVVTELPENIRVRFAEDPLSIDVRTVEQGDRSPVTLAVTRVSPRNYSIALPDGIMTRDDSSLVLLIEALSTDGHKEGGVFLLHVKPAAAITAPVVPSVAPTTPTAPSLVPAPSVAPVPFQPPTPSTSSTPPFWLIAAALCALSAALTHLLHTARSRRRKRPR